MEIAAELFATQGYQKTSIRDVARRASVTTGAIYGHFASKADLLAAAIGKRTADDVEGWPPTTSVERDFVEVITESATTSAERTVLRSLIVQGAAAAMTDEATGERLREEQLAYLRTWISRFERVRDRQGIHPALDMEAAVLCTWAVEVGLGVLESFGIAPSSGPGWTDVKNRLARSWRLEPEVLPAERRRARARRG